MKAVIKWGVVLAAVVALVLGVARFVRKDRVSVQPTGASFATAATTAGTQPASTPVPQAEPVPTSVSSSAVGTLPPEVAATRRMYGAHAPLRTPAIADPDSEANRRILQTMVQKALANANASAAPAAK